MNINTNLVLEQIASLTSIEELTSLKAEYFGKTGVITTAMKSMRDLNPEERKTFAASVNEAKEILINGLNVKEAELKEAALLAKIKADQINVNLDAVQYSDGHPHVLNKVVDDLSDYFISKGYYVANGPEVETEDTNFEKLNIPKTHPARDMQDSLYIDADKLLRTHTSPTQVREMMKNGADIKLICPGDVFRRDEDDATHSHQFMQIEGLVLGEEISMAHLKTTLQGMAEFLFGKDTNIRMRPSYFPFTEPSVEVDVTCFNCGGDGCHICKKSGWIEILGAGMVHPNVLESCGIDSDKVSGFAFGLGVDRVAMLKYQIKDIRDIYTNDMRFNNQFKMNGGLK